MTGEAHVAAMLRSRRREAFNPIRARISRLADLVWSEEHTPLDLGIFLRDQREHRRVDAFVDAAEAERAELHVFQQKMARDRV